MIAIKRILCPVDLSDCSRRALAHASALAARYQAALAILHTYQIAPLPIGQVQDLPMATFTPPIDESEILQDVQKFCAPVLGSNRAANIEIRLGDPTHHILKLAGELGSDLIVMGTHGRGGLDRLVLGSVTEKTLRKASCPVLTIPPHSEAHAASVAFNRILCPLDFSDSSLKALDYAFSLARQQKSRVTLLHVLEWLYEERSQSEEFNAGVVPLKKYLEDEARRMLAGTVPADAASWCTPEVQLVWGKPYQEILRAARESKADLVVMGVVGRGAIDLMMFGSTTHHVLRAAECPVLTVRTSV
jgi:nucleotide-binding universal stress UspA family protein